MKDRVAVKIIEEVMILESHARERETITSVAGGARARAVGELGGEALHGHGGGGAVTVLELIAESLGLAASHFAGHLVGDDSLVRLLRLNHGPACPRPDLTWGSCAHTDPLAITLLHQDLTGGLQFRTRAGAWYRTSGTCPVSGPGPRGPVADALIVYY